MNFEPLAAVCGGAAGSLLLLFAPGSWITFGLPLRLIPFWARLLTGVALSPFIVAVEFFAIRSAGLSFDSTVVSLLILNLPGLYLIFRNLSNAASPRRDAWVLALSVLLPCLALMAKLILSLELRLYAPHTLVYSDPVYMLARGDLILEDPSLAGIRMSYPVWPALVFQSLISFLLHSTPATNWVWTNLACLLVICSFAVGITRELGGGRLAQASAAIWLMLGINPVGYTLSVALPEMAGRHLFGDARYMPWVRKFQLFSTMPLGMAMIAAMLYLLIATDLPDIPVLIILGLLLTGTGLLYPLVFPPACGIVAAKILSLSIYRGKFGVLYLLGRIAPLALVLVISLAICYAEIKFLQQARHTGSAVLLSTLTAFGRKAVVSLIAMSILLAGLLIVGISCWRRKPEAMVVLLAGALASTFLHSALAIPFWDNEYKFIFLTAMCLACFPALAIEQLWRRLPAAGAFSLSAACVALLVVPYIHADYLVANPDPTAGPIQTAGFDLRLEPESVWASICGLVKSRTPANAILVTQSSDVYFPAFTNRDLYVPPSDQFFRGVTLKADVLAADIRGNGHAILKQRRQVLASLFEGDASDRSRALDELLSFGRPLAILVEPRHAGLLNWLKQAGRGTEVSQAHGIDLWVIAAPQTREGD